jgi:UPF0755 protein
LTEPAAPPVPAPEPAKPRRHGGCLRRLFLLAGLLLFLAAGAAAGGWLWLQRIYLPAEGPLAESATIVLPRGAGLAGISQLLAEAGIIEQPLAFGLAARLSGRDRRLQAGEYRFEPGISPDAVLAKLEQGDVLLHKMTLPEGLTTAEIYAELAAAPFLSGDLPPPPAEGSLLPDTWLVPLDEPRAKLVARMAAAMQKALDEAWAARAADLPLKTEEDALILASIIEKETALPAEYPLVAAVFVNRLHKGMPLQTDPTVIYALTGGKAPLDRELTRADLALDDPYNTYLHPGLPPGPITNPGKGAIQAAVAPADVPYLYFVADGTGGHAFATTLAEHNRNVAKWRKAKREG